MEITLKGKRALVTGANSGIGEAIALALGAAGADVAINYRSRPEDAETIAKTIEAAGTRALTVQADVSDAAQVARMFEQVDDAWGGVDILVNNAGVDGERQLSWESDLDAWDKVLKINLNGTFYCAHQALKRMVPQKSGVILNISSVHETIPWTGYSAYTAAKAGVAMLTRTLSQEAAPFGVRVIALAPGAIKTPINQDVWQDPEGAKDLLEKIPMGRIGETSDVSKMVVFLASDAAGYVTGTSVFVDGGMTDYPDFAHGG